MKKVELLVPAGNMECLKQAIYNGADAVYLGCKNFGARKFADNFNNNEIIEAINLAHLYGVRLYVTMNTLIKDEEVDSFLKQVEFLYESGVDAILLQDFGMICLIRQMYPKLEIHASTQANNSSAQTVELFYKLGVKRVVLSREMSLNEIKNINVPIEKEVFIHGALCISYSGCCLMSSMQGGRSGNRGECTGCCRLPYNLEYNNKQLISDKYLLSTKELNTTEYIDEILNSNIDSLKIEGRMKSPEYVGFITSFYRKLINKEKIDIVEETDKLKTIYNRKFTKGHILNCTNEELLNQDNPNHIGLEIGKVIKVTDSKITIKLNKNRSLNQYDGIRFLKSNTGFIVNFLYDKNDKLINSSNDICIVDNKVDLKINDIVCKTIDYNLMSSLKVLPTKKIPINIKVSAITGEKLTLISDNIKVEGQIVSKAENCPITKERIIEQIKKLGNTPFYLENIEVNSSNDIFISISELNNLRRKLIEELLNQKTTKKISVTKEKVNLALNKPNLKKDLVAEVYTEEQLLTCQKLNFDRIIVNDIDLYEKYKSNNIILNIERCSRKPLNHLRENNLVSDYFDFANHDNLYGNYGLNVYNTYTAYYLYKMNLKSITISKELTPIEIENFIELFHKRYKFYPNIDVVVYGRTENMVIKGNILNLQENDYNYSLIDKKNNKFPIYFSKNTSVLNYQNTNIYSNFINEHSNIRFDFYNETEKEIEAIVKQYQ